MQMLHINRKSRMHGNKKSGEDHLSSRGCNKGLRTFCNITVLVQSFCKRLPAAKYTDIDWDNIKSWISGQHVIFTKRSPACGNLAEEMHFNAG